jgi:hypothetical protein
MRASETAVSPLGRVRVRVRQEGEQIGRREGRRWREGNGG